MKYVSTLLLAASLALTGTAAATTGGQQGGSCVVQGHQLNATHNLPSAPAEPYSHLLPTSLKESAPNVNPYSLNLKPLKANELSELQFKTRDNLGPGAGYSSPYLWEVGRGPSYQPSQRGWYNGGYAPVPAPTRY